MSKDLPNFSYPAYKYAKRIIAYLEILEVDQKNKDEIKKYAPALLSKLPYEIFELLPKKSDIKQILDVLETYDKDEQTLGTLMSSTSPIENSPSLDFAAQVSRLRAAMGPKTDGDVLKELAWATLSNKFPANLQQLICVLDIDKFPDDAKLRQIDKLYNKVFEQKSCNAVSADDTVQPLVAQSSVSNVDSRLDRLESQFEKMLNIVEQGQKVPPGTSADDPSLCFFHNKYKHNSLKCQAPCSFFDKYNICSSNAGQYRPRFQNNFPAFRPPFEFQGNRPQRFAPVQRFTHVPRPSLNYLGPPSH